MIITMQLRIPQTIHWALSDPGPWSRHWLMTGTVNSYLLSVIQSWISTASPPLNPKELKENWNSESYSEVSFPFVLTLIPVFRPTCVFLSFFTLKPWLDNTSGFQFRREVLLPTLLTPLSFHPGAAQLATQLPGTNALPAWLCILPVCSLTAMTPRWDSK